MNPTVEQILRDNYVDGVFHTHVSMLQPRGKFQFNREKLELFWDVYCTKIKNDTNRAQHWWRRGSIRDIQCLRWFWLD